MCWLACSHILLQFVFIRFARASSSVSDFNCRNKALTAKLLRQGYRYHKLRKTFSKFYQSGLVEKNNVSLRKLLQQGISEPEFYDVLVYKVEKMRGNLIFLNNFENLLTGIKE